MRRTAARISGKSSPRVSVVSLIAASAPFKARLALLIEGADAFAPVLGRNQAVIGFDLELEAAAQIELQTGMNRFLRLAHRERRIGADRGRGGERFVHQPLALDDAVDDAPGQRFGRPERPPGE